MTFPLKASPQILSRGNFSFSISRCGIFSLARNSEAVLPAGPAPMITTGDVSSIPGKDEKLCCFICFAYLTVMQILKGKKHLLWCRIPHCHTVISFQGYTDVKKINTNHLVLAAHDFF
jgi:hypothetical protein